MSSMFTRIIRFEFSLSSCLQKKYIYHILTKLPIILHIHKHRIFCKYDWNFLDQPLLSYNFFGRDM